MCYHRVCYAQHTRLMSIFSSHILTINVLRVMKVEILHSSPTQFIKRVAVRDSVLCTKSFWFVFFVGFLITYLENQFLKKQRSWRNTVMFWILAYARFQGYRFVIVAISEDACCCLHRCWGGVCFTNFFFFIWNTFSAFPVVGVNWSFTELTKWFIDSNSFILSLAEAWVAEQVLSKLKSLVVT